MELLIALAVIGVIGGIVGFRSAGKKKAEEAARLQSYNLAVDAARSTMITGPGAASFPVVNPDDIGYRPVGGEKIVAVQDGATKMELRSTGRYQTGGTTVSIPIMKGVRYRVGTGTIRSEKEWQGTAFGRLILTDKAFVFEGNEKNERITWTQVANAELLSDGFRVFKRTGPPRTFAVERPDPKFAAALDLMLRRVD